MKKKFNKHFDDYDEEYEESLYIGKKSSETEFNNKKLKEINRKKSRQLKQQKYEE